jgi:hypothetical protein
MKEEEPGLPEEEEPRPPEENQQPPPESSMVDEHMKGTSLDTCEPQESSPTGSDTGSVATRLPRRLKRLADSKKRSLVVSSEKFPASKVSHDTPRHRKNVEFGIGDKAVLHHKEVALPALVVECSPSGPETSVITTLLAEACSLLAQDELDDVKAQLRSVVWLQSTGVSVTSDEILQFGKLIRVVLTRMHLEARNLAFGKLVAPVLEFNKSREHVSNVQEAQLARLPAQQGFESLKQDFQ